jgi:hypothetical protein
MLGDGTLKTIEDDQDIYISLTQLCEYLTVSAQNMSNEVANTETKNKKYVQGLLDMMYTIADEVVQLGKFEAQRRLINSPQDLLDMVDSKPFGNVE